MDADGDVVWWATGPTQNSRSHLSWDGTHMYMMSLNVQNSSRGKSCRSAWTGPEVRRSRNGGVPPRYGLDPHGVRDLAVEQGGMDAPCSLVEVTDGTWATKTVVADMSSVYTSNTFHTNAIHYYPKDDSYTVGDCNPNLYVKLTRAGVAGLAVRRVEPQGRGQDLLGRDRLAGESRAPPARRRHVPVLQQQRERGVGLQVEYDEHDRRRRPGPYTASGATSSVLGDVQGLPNGNMLVTFSTSARSTR